MNVRKHNFPAILCVLVALVVRIIVFSFFQDSILYQPIEGSSHDRSIYIEAAEAASNGAFFPEGAFEFLPLYPWLLGLLGLVFGTGPVSAAALGILCDLATTFLIVVFAQRLGASKLISTIAGLLFAAYPLTAVYSILAMPNTLNTLGVTTFVFAAHTLLGGQARASRFLSLGLLAGVLSLGFAGMILIAISIAIIAMIKTRSWLAPTLLIIGTAIPITPVAIHNSRAEGSFVMLTTHGGFNFYMGNHERATGYPLKVLNFRMTAKEMLEDAHHYAEQSSGQSMSRAESSSWWSDQANAFWKTNPLNATVLTAKKVALFWNHRDMDDLRILEQLRVSDSFFNYFRGTPFALFGILGLIGVVFARGAIIPRTALLVGMASIALFFITARYRLTFVPLMAIIGSVGTMQLMRNWRAGNRAKTLFLIPIILLVLFPFSVRDQRPVDYYNTAIQLTAEQKLDEALEIVNLGLEIDPNFGSLHFAKGNVLFTQENYADAVEAFKIARTLSPENTTILFNLALSYARMGDYCGARDVLKGQSLDAKSSALFKELNAACDQ